MSCAVPSCKRATLAAVILTVIAGLIPSRASPVSAKTEAFASRQGGDRLRALIAEALEHSPKVIAARNRWQALTKVPIQVRTLPDPVIGLQQFTVGSPKPFAGYETSDFYYTGFGVSQEIPWPSKLSLKGAVAEKDAESARHQYEAAEREVIEKVREGYFELFYLSRTLALLRRTRNELQQIEGIVEALYRVGEAQQQDVIRAQLKMTEILKQEELISQATGERQAELKAVLGRDSDSRDVEIGDVQPTSLNLGAAELSILAKARSPEISRDRSAEARGLEALKLARKGYIPDLSLGYAYEKTGPGFRDYFVWTLGVKIPLYFWRKQTPAIEQASLDYSAAHAQTRATELDVTATAQSQLIALKTANRVLTIYRDGLIPQAENSLKSALAAYQVGKVDFLTVLSAFIDVLDLNQEYYRELADHEIAVAKVEAIIGDVR